MYSPVILPKYLLKCLRELLGSDVPCRVGHNPTKSSPTFNINGMTFLNREFPAECDGEITAWNYCYYSDNLSDAETYTATVAIWRFNNVTGRYNVVSTSVLSLTHRTRQLLADIYCRQESLAPENYPAIREGDIIGVSLPPDNPIRMIGASNLDSYVISRYDGSTSTLSSASPGDLSPVSMSLHLYADISTSTSGTTRSMPSTGGENGQTSEFSVPVLTFYS